MHQKGSRRTRGRTNAIRRMNRLKQISQPGKVKSRQRQKRLDKKQRRQITLAAAGVILVLLVSFSIFLHRLSLKLSLPLDEPSPGGQVEEAGESIPVRFLERLLGQEIPGMELPAADGRARIQALLCTVLYTLTGIDLGNPCSILDLELGVGMRVSLPAVTPSSSTGSGHGTLPESDSEKANSESELQGGSCFTFPVFGYDEAKILLYHTHASESFTCDVASESVPTVVTVGEELARILEESYGLPVLHHRGVYDLPRRYAYGKARPVIEKIIAENPGIELVIDLHRDGVVRSKTTATMEERELAKILLVHGRRNPESKKNLEFSLCVQRELEAVAPPLSRGLLQQDFIYNQDLHPYAILIEVGGHENSLEEAERTIPYLAEAIARSYCIFFLRD